MIEPTETESPQTLRGAGRGPRADRRGGHGGGTAPPCPRPRGPHPVRRVDEARAARTLIPTFDARP